MYYALIVLSVVCIVATFSFGKLYRLRVSDTLQNVLLKITVEALFASLLFFSLGGFRLQLSGYLLILAALMAVVTMASIFVCFEAYGRGNLSLFAVFQMQGGMLLPYLFGIWYGNRVSVWCVIGLLLMMVSLLFTVDYKGSKRGGRLFLLFCIGIFFINGTVSILSYIFSNGIFGTSVTAPVDALYSFVSVKALFAAAFAALSLAVLRLFRRTPIPASVPDGKEKSRVAWLPLVLILLGSAACDSIGYVITLGCAGHLPAVALYPMVTGGTVILSALAGRVLFHERLTSRNWLGIGLTFAATLLFMF